MTSTEATDVHTSLVLREIKSLVENGIRLQMQLGKLYDERSQAMMIGNKEVVKTYKPAIIDCQSDLDDVARRIGDLMIRHYNMRG